MLAVPHTMAWEGCHMAAGEVFVHSNTIANARGQSNQAAFTYRIEYPRFVANTPLTSLRRINERYRQQAQYLAQSAQATYARPAEEDRRRLERGGGDAFSPYELLRTFEVTYGQNCVLSLYLDEYLYTGGAHGTTRRTADTWDVRSDRPVPLSALFPQRADYADRLRDAVAAEVARRGAGAAGSYFEDYETRISEYFNPESFYLTPEALVLYYQQYELGPYATGIPTFSLPYAEVGARIPGC
jgi:hypothetical protein